MPCTTSHLPALCTASPHSSTSHFSWHHTPYLHQQSPLQVPGRRGSPLENQVQSRICCAVMGESVCMHNKSVYTQHAAHCQDCAPQRHTTASTHNKIIHTLEYPKSHNFNKGRGLLSSSVFSNLMSRDTIFCVRVCARVCLLNHRNHQSPPTIPACADNQRQ